MQQMTYDQIADLTRQIVKEEVSKSTPVNGVLSAVVATSSIDGKLTLADIIVAGMIPIGFLAAGVTLASGAVLAGASLSEAGEIAGRTFQVGGVLAGLRLATDAIDPLGMIKRFKEFREWEKKYYPPPEQEKSESTVRIEIKDDNSFRFMHFDAIQTGEAIEFAKEFLIISESSDYPTAEKHYVGKGKVWPNGEQGRADWQEFRNALINVNLAFEKGNRWYLTEGGKRTMKKLSRVE